MNDSFNSSPFYKLHGVFADEERIILLGPSNSGKTTFRMQMESWSQPYFNDAELSQFEYVLKENIISFIQSVHKKMEKDGIEMSKNFSQLIDPFIQYKSDSMVFSENDIDSLKSIIKNGTFSKYAIEMIDYQYPHAIHFINESETLFDKNYHFDPSTIARLRVRTVGFTRQPFIINGNIKQIIDVGGATMERNKANTVNSGISKVLFFINLSDIDLPLFEDETKNRFEDAIQMYQEVCSNPAYESSQFYLLLTHSDRLEERIRHSNFFKTFFPDFQGDPHNIKECISFISNKIISSSMRPVAKFVCNLIDITETRDIIFNIVDL